MTRQRVHTELLQSLKKRALLFSLVMLSAFFSLQAQGPTAIPNGSLVIGMDNTTQDDGSGEFNMFAYGLANELLQNEIPLFWAIRPGKIKDGIDFSAVSQREFPSVTAAVSYDFISGPLIIDSTYADSARTIIANYGNAVRVYRLINDETIDIEHILTHKPKIAVLKHGGNEDIHSDLLLEAGISTAYFDEVISSSSLNAGCAYTLASEPHWDSQDLSDTVETRWVEQFIMSGGNFMAQCDAILTFEYLENFQTNGGLTDAGSMVNDVLIPDATAMQFEGILKDIGGSVSSFELNSGASFKAGTHIHIKENGSTQHRVTQKKVSSTALGGNVFYLGGHEYKKGSNSEINGRRIYLNAILTPAERPASTGINFDTDYSLSASLNQTLLCVGDTANYELVVSNSGPGDADELRSRVVLPPLANLLNIVTSQGSFDQGSRIWDIGTVNNGSTALITIQFVITTPGSYNADASATAFSFDFNKGNNAAFLNFSVISQPTPVDAGLDQGLCHVYNGVLNAATPSNGSGEWTVLSGPGSLASPTNTNTNISGLQTGINQFIWTVSNSACPVISDTIDIDVSLTPSPAMAGFDKSYCDIYTHQLGATPPLVGVGNWTVLSGTASLTNNADPAAIASGLSPGINELLWSVSNGGCSTNLDTISFNISAIPTLASAGPDVNICGDSTTLVGNTALVGTGVWTIMNGGGTFSNINDPNAKLTQMPPGGEALIWTISNGVCPATADTIEMTIWKLPSLAEAGPDISLCDVLTTTMNAVEPSVGTGIWSIASGLANIQSGHDTATQVTSLIVGNTQLVWTVYNGNCPSNNDTVSVVVSEMPSLAMTSPDQNLCDLFGTNVWADPIQIGTGVWSFVSGGGNISDPGSSVITINSLEEANNLLVWTVTSGSCPTSSDTISINSWNTPSPADAGQNFKLCTGRDIILNATDPAIGVGTWDILQGNAYIEDIHYAHSRVSQQGADQLVLKWTVSNGTCPDNIDEVVYEFTEAGFAADAGNDQETCGSVMILEGNTIFNTTGNWALLGPGGVINDPTSSFTIATKLPPGNYTAIWTLTDGECTSSDEFNFTTMKSPGNIHAGEDQEVQLTNHTRMNAIAPDNGIGSWELVSGFGIIEDVLDPNSKITKLSKGTNIFQWTAGSGDCIVNDQVILERIKFNNGKGFSPNADGVNDYFHIKELEHYPNTYIEIYTRWGTKVYQSDNYHNDWDGRDRKGNQLPDDTYYFVLKLETKEKVKGFVVLNH